MTDFKNVILFFIIICIFYYYSDQINCEDTIQVNQIQNDTQNILDSTKSTDTGKTVSGSTAQNTISSLEKSIEVRDLPSKKPYIILTSDELGRYPGISAGDLLEIIPGLNVERMHYYGVIEHLVPEGTSPSQASFSLNGMPLYNPNTGFIDLGALPLGALDRLEIYRDVPAASFSENSILHIDFFSRHGETDKPFSGIKLDTGYYRDYQDYSIFFMNKFKSGLKSFISFDYGSPSSSRYELNKLFMVFDINNNQNAINSSEKTPEEISGKSDGNDTNRVVNTPPEINNEIKYGFCLSYNDQEGFLGNQADYLEFPVMEINKQRNDFSAYYNDSPRQLSGNLYFSEIMDNSDQNEIQDASYWFKSMVYGLSIKKGVAIWKRNKISMAFHSQLINDYNKNPSGTLGSSFFTRIDRLNFLDRIIVNEKKGIVSLTGLEIVKKPGFSMKILPYTSVNFKWLENIETTISGMKILRDHSLNEMRYLGESEGNEKGNHVSADLSIPSFHDVNCSFHLFYNDFEHSPFWQFNTESEKYELQYGEFNSYGLELFFHRKQFSGFDFFGSATFHHVRFGEGNDAGVYPYRPAYTLKFFTGYSGRVYRDKIGLRAGLSMNGRFDTRTCGIFGRSELPAYLELNFKLRATIKDFSLEYLVRNLTGGELFLRDGTRIKGQYQSLGIIWYFFN